MDDLSLDELQAALESVQDTKPATRLSERNVVELVNKLLQLGYLGPDLLHSINGREYITADRLCADVAAAVDGAGGRISVVDLPPLLGVDITHCERQAARAVEQSGGGLQLLQGELFAQHYFTTTATEINELLQEASVLSMGDIAKRFRLSADLVQSTLAAHLGGRVQGRFESGILYTAAYIHLVKAQLRGALRAAMCPVNLGSLTRELGVHATASTAKTVAALVEELLAEGAARGSLKAGLFVPAVFAEAQQRAAHSFYAQNSYVEYAMLERLGIANARAYMEAAFPDGIALAAAFAAPGLTAQLDAAAEDALGSGGWLDAQAALPSSLGAADAAALLRRSPAVAKHEGARDSGLRLYDGTCLMSAALFDDLQRRALDAAREAASAELQQRRASAAAASTPAPTDSGGKGAPKKAVATPADDDSDDDWDTGKGGKKKKGKRKGGGGGGGGGKGKAAAAPPTKGKKAGKQGAGETGSEAVAALSLEALTARVEEWLPEAAGAGESGGLADALAADLRPAALAEFESALAAIFLAGAEARRRRREELAKALQEGFQRLQLYARGVELAAADEARHGTLQRHLLRGLGLQLLDLLLRHQEVEQQKGEEQGEAQQEAAPAAQPLSAAERAAVLKGLPPDLAPSAAAADKALSGADVAAAQAALEAAAADAGVPLRPLDKKAEKALLAEHRAALQAKLAGLQEPAEALALLVPLLAVKLLGQAVSVPGKALAGVIELLRPQLEADAFAKLAELHALVVESLRAGGGGGSGAGNPRLAALLPEVKLIAGVGAPAEPGRSQS